MTAGVGAGKEVITKTAEDHLKAIWSALEWGGTPATIKELAERFGTTAAAASSTVKRLAGQGLLVHEPYKAIVLTPVGERVAVGMVRRHRLIETFLVNQLGYSWDEVHEEAENLEHSVSEMMIDRIDPLLGHPHVDPHGDPIPTRRGEVSYPAGAQRLSEVGAGEYFVTRISDDSSERLEWFQSVGIGRDVLLKVLSIDSGGTRVLVAAQELLLTPEVGGLVIVIGSEPSHL